ncbi:MAG: hypothetical protein PHD97_06885 [Bacteroidales bacterium]|nr:hypothetical protein [Bacteroidales bacterium]
MRILLFVFIIFVIGFKTAKTQDLIVTDKGDSLNCKITKIKSDYIYFTFKYENEIRNTLLPLSQVKFYKKDFYSRSEVPAEKLKNKLKYKKVKISAYGGWSYMTGTLSSDIPDDFRQYYKELKSGYHFGGEAGYFISEAIGLGIKYANFRTSNIMSNIYVKDTITGAIRTGILKNDITVQYFGPSLYVRFYSKNKMVAFTSNYSMGYLYYKNDVVVVDRYTLISGTVGMIYDFGVDFMLDRNLAFGLGFSYVMGTLNEYKTNNGSSVQTIKLKNNELESISRIDLSMGIKLNL